MNCVANFYNTDNLQGKDVRKLTPCVLSTKEDPSVFEKSNNIKIPNNKKSENYRWNNFV